MDLPSLVDDLLLLPVVDYAIHSLRVLDRGSPDLSAAVDGSTLVLSMIPVHHKFLHSDDRDLWRSLPFTFDADIWSLEELSTFESLLHILRSSVDVDVRLQVSMLHPDLLTVHALRVCGQLRFASVCPDIYRYFSWMRSADEWSSLCFVLSVLRTKLQVMYPGDWLRPWISLREYMEPPVSRYGRGRTLRACGTPSILLQDRVDQWPDRLVNGLCRDYAGRVLFYSRGSSSSQDCVLVLCSGHDSVLYIPLEPARHPNWIALAESLNPLSVLRCVNFQCIIYDGRCVANVLDSNLPRVHPGPHGLRHFLPRMRTLCDLMRGEISWNGHLDVVVIRQLLHPRHPDHAPPLCVTVHCASRIRYLLLLGIFWNLRITPPHCSYRKTSDVLGIFL